MAQYSTTLHNIAKHGTTIAQHSATLHNIAELIIKHLSYILYSWRDNYDSFCRLKHVDVDVEFHFTESS